ncbi:MAG: glycosyl hydrolase 115 family protein [Clostridia bacterium]|nr:glycosyl hydrolase 115 family protein [Clostridia bacterium]
MFLFQDNQSIDICLKNQNPYVRLALEDLRKDFLRCSYLSKQPAIVEEEKDFCLVIEETSETGGDPLQGESFSIVSDGAKIRIKANGYLGMMWGIYTFSEKILGVSPCYLFNDLETEKRRCLEVGDIHIEETPQRVGFRGVFINDEDLLTEWKEGGGARRMDYPFYKVTVAESVMDMVVETVLRLRLNLVIPASFLDIDNPPEKVLADCVAKRGIFLSQHHIEPLGLSHFTFEGYCKKLKKDGEYSYIHNSETLIEAWEYYAKKWAQYDNVVWQVGLRGKADRPVWEEDTPTEKELKTYAEYISNAIKKQKEIVLQATGGRAKYFSTTLWMEGSMLAEKGLLDLDKDTIIVFADNGPNQMFGKDYDKVPRQKGLQYGIYYHVQYYDIGPHLAPQTGLNKLYYNIQRTKNKGDDSYYILNVSNVREFVFEMQAYAEMLWNFNDFSTEKYMEGYCKLYGEYAQKAKEFITAFFDNLPSLPTADLQYVHANYFNYDYEEISPNVKNFIIKDGLIMARGGEIAYHFREELYSPIYRKMYEGLKDVLPIYERLACDLERWSEALSERLKGHVRCKWWLYTKTLLHMYRWYVCLYEAKECYDVGENKKSQALLNAACESLEEYLSLRKCAEYGEFENWYRGELKMNVKQRLYRTKQLLG